MQLIDLYSPGVSYSAQVVMMPWQPVFIVCSWDTLWVENLTHHQHAGCHGNDITICNDICLIALPVLHDTCKVMTKLKNLL